MSQWKKRGMDIMSGEILVTLLGLSGSAIGSLIGIFTNSRLVNYRIQQLEKKVSEHNNLVTRTYQLEQDNKVQDEKLKVMNHRIKDLEEEQHEHN